MLNVVIIHTTRGGRDPEEYLHVVTESLAELLDPQDPWPRLGHFEDKRDPGILAGYLESVKETIAWTKRRGCNVIKTMKAAGY
jgi:hypothetical protein